MIGVLVVVFGADGVTRGLRVTRQLEVFLGDVVGGAADLHVRSVGLEAAGKRILALAIPATSAPILLSLPHCLKGSRI